MDIESQEINVVKTASAVVDFSAMSPDQPSADNVNENITNLEEESATADPESTEVDSEEQELLKLLEDGEESETEDEAEPEPEESDDEDFQAKFDTHFEKTFGLKPEEAVQLVQELVQERIDREVRGQLQELQTVWGTDDSETQARLEAVRDVYNSLSPENQAKFNNVKGAQVIWNRIVAQGKAPKLTKGKAAKPTGAKANFMYTQAQIDAMPISEYQKEAQRIAYAYANGLVKK